MSGADRTPELDRLLCLLRTAACTAGVADSFFLEDYRTGSRRPLSRVLSGDDATSPELAYFHGYQGEPRWVRLGSENRLAWVARLPAVLAAWQGLPVSVSLDSSWRWDYSVRDPAGRPRYVPVYQALVLFASSRQVAFDAPAACRALLSNICAVSHPLADMELFDWQRATCGTLLFNSYRWTRDGFEATFLEKGLLERAQQELLDGLDVQVRKHGAGASATWEATVRFPARASSLDDLPERF